MRNKIITAAAAVALAVLCFFAGRFSVPVPDRGGESSLKTGSPSGTPGSEFKMDLNEATVDELCDIPGIGEATARKIIEYRTKNGPYRSVSELLAVSGIGESLLKTAEEYLTVK